MATAAGSITAIETFLRENLGDGRYDLWFSNTKFKVKDHQLVVGVPNLYFHDWLKKKYGRLLESAAKDALGRGYSIKFLIDPELFRAARAQQEDAKKDARPTEKRAAARPVVELPPVPPHKARRGRKGKSATATPSLFPDSNQSQTQLNGKAISRRWRQLTDFIIGASNRVAYAAAQSVVEEPAQGANPLTIHGPVGTGKTHLLEGIYAGIKKRQPGAAVRYVTAEDFTNRFVSAMRLGKLVTFRRQFRDCDVLLLDNLHFLTRKKATVEEFLHTFDVLAAADKQIVVTTDCHPRLAEDMLPEVVDRLLGGAVWGLQPPDAKTRLEIMRAKSGEVNLEIPEDVIQDLAARLRGNVRELEGAVGNLRHYAKVVGKVVDRALAEEALGDLLRHAVRVVSLEDIDEAVCQALRLRPKALQCKARAWSVSHPRMVAVYLARKHTAAPYGEIGRHFGGRNHSTAVAAEKKVREWIDEDQTLNGGVSPWKVRELVEAVERLLGLQ